MTNDFKDGFLKIARTALFSGARQVSRSHSDYLRRIGATGKDTGTRTAVYGRTPGKKGTAFKSMTETPSTRVRTERGPIKRTPK